MAVTKKPIYPFEERQSWDIFDVFDGAPRAKQATAEMKALCDKFVMDYNHTAHKYMKEGLADSASREMVIRYILEKLEPWRKTWRNREEKGLKPLPPHVSRRK
jgi:hypothetical protein